MDKYIYTKVKKVIESCKTYDQLVGAKRYCNLLVGSNTELFDFLLKLIKMQRRVIRDTYKKDS